MQRASNGSLVIRSLGDVLFNGVPYQQCFQYPIGTFKAQLGSRLSCAACPTGKYQDEPGQTSCKLVHNCLEAKTLCQLERPSASCDSGLYNLTGVLKRGTMVYCNMTTGLALIQARGCASNPAYTELAVVTPASCGYLSRSTVMAIANFSTRVELKDGGVATHSSSAAVLSALRLGQSWHTGPQPPAFSNPTQWEFRAVCTPDKMTADGWPWMYHSCGVTSAVHWVPAAVHMHARAGRGPSLEGQTWLGKYAT